MAHKPDRKPVPTLSGKGTASAPTGSGPGLTTGPTASTLSGTGVTPSPTGSGDGLVTRDWRSWLPEGAGEPQVLIPRAELLARVATVHQVTITERELRYWEALGALPTPVLRHHEGALRALYPAWYHSVVAQVPALRVQGLDWDAVRERTRDQFREDALARSRMMEAEDPERLRDTPPPMSPELVAAVRALLAQVSHETGVPIDYARIDLVDNSGQHRLRYRVAASNASDEG